MAKIRRLSGGGRRRRDDVEYTGQYPQQLAHLASHLENVTSIRPTTILYILRKKVDVLFIIEA